MIHSAAHPLDNHPAPTTFSIVFSFAVALGIF